jgi:uncharacterized membrane protein
MVVFGLALVAAFLLAVFLPDLVPAAAHGEAATVAHARVVSTVQPSPIPSEAPLPSAQPLASAPASPVASDAATAPGQSPAPAPSGQPATGGVQAAPGPGSAGSGEPLQAVVQFIDGPYAGQEGQGIIQGPSGALELPDYRPGDEVVVEIDTAPDGTTSMVLIDRWRLPLLEMLLGAFAVTAAAVAGWRGLRAIAALALTLVLTLRLFVPLVIRGWDPVALAIVFGILMTTLSFMLTQGINRTTLAAIAGTSLGLGVTGVLAAVVTASAHFTPAQGSDQVVYLAQLTNGSIDLSGLLLAAVIFGGLGVLNDVAITQAATVEELHLANPALTPWQLFGRTMNVGVSHLAATINTLVFAYLGTALPLVVLIVLQVSNMAATVSEEGVAVEIIRTLVGAIGVLAAVPLTTAIACRWVVVPGGSAGPVPGEFVADVPREQSAP